MIALSKHRRTWNASVYQRYLREGRGQGAGAAYTPWIRIQDFSSKGMVSRAKGAKTGRVHHFLSNLEMAFFYLLDWSDDVLDICEQYPLIDLSSAVEIAERAQIHYPYDAKSGFPYVMTSDFFISTINGPSAIAVKTSDELSKPRVREKLEIERRYWDIHNVRWRVVTEKQINRTKAKNIEWLSQASSLSHFGIHEEDREIYIAYFMVRYTEASDPLSRIICGIEQDFNLAPGMGLNIYKHLAYWKRIAFDVCDEVDGSIFTGKNQRQDAWWTS